MPNKNEKPKPQTDEERNKLLDESMQRAYAKVASEMPDIKPVSVSPRQSSIFANMLMPRQAFATTNPFTGNITYNPELMAGQSPMEMENTLAHELTHVRQTQNTPFWQHMINAGRNMMGMDTPNVPSSIPQSSPLKDEYYWRPPEMEAFQTEKNRALSQHQDVPDPMTGSRDIILPRRKKSGIDTSPSVRR